MNELVMPEEVIINKIYVIRGEKVMLDSDLAQLYGIGTKVLKQAVHRNMDRFPDDFMFILDRKEFANLRSQFVTSSWGGTRHPPMAFTEQGVAMLSSVLKSKKAILINILIIRTFTKLRRLLGSNQELFLMLNEIHQKEIEHDQQIRLILDYLKQLEQTNQEEKGSKNRRRIGFRQDQNE